MWEGAYRGLKWALVVIPVGFLGLIAFTVLTGFTGDLVTYAGVTHQPESGLFYPGAVLERSRAMGDHADAMFGRYYPAYISSVLRTNASPAAIREWYRARLSSDGWTVGRLMATALHTTGLGDAFFCSSFTTQALMVTPSALPIVGTINLATRISHRHSLATT
jgi:hypothetical protein